MNPSTLLQTIRQLFMHNANADDAIAHQRYMKSSMPFWGVRKPMITALTKPLFKEHKPTTHEQYAQTVAYLFTHATHREEWYAALNYAQMFPVFITPANIDLYCSLIRQAQWWDIVDTVAANLVGKALQNSPERTAYLEQWITDPCLWIRRTAIIAQLKYKKSTDSTLLYTLIRKTAHEKDFFMRKAIGWALREYSKTNPASVVQFIGQNSTMLSPLSIREGLKIVQR